MLGCVRGQVNEPECADGAELQILRAITPFIFQGVWGCSQKRRRVGAETIWTGRVSELAVWSLLSQVIESRPQVSSSSKAPISNRTSTFLRYSPWAKATIHSEKIFLYSSSEKSTKCFRLEVSLGSEAKQRFCHRCVIGCLSNTHLIVSAHYHVESP